MARRTNPKVKKQFYITGPDGKRNYHLYRQLQVGGDFAYSESGGKKDYLRGAPYLKKYEEIEPPTRNPVLADLASGLVTGTGMGLAAGITAPLMVRGVKGVGRQLGIGKRKRGRGRGNPSESLQEAEALSSTFHGRPVQEIYEEEEVIDYRTNLAGLGRLREVEILDRTGEYSIPISFNGKAGGRGVTLTSDPSGKQLFFIGGNQSLDLSKLDVPKAEQAKDLVEVGEVLTISYYTDKHHLDGPEYQKKGTEYIHEFGEGGGARPRLVYDVMNKGMVLVGGEYRVVEEGIVD